jgi:hypothetical protein
MKHINDIIKTYGSHENLNRDLNCCAVAALSASMEVPYDDAYKFAEREWGRKKREGTQTFKLLSSFENKEEITVGDKTKQIIPIKATHVYHQYGKDIERAMSLKTFLKVFNKGIYYIIIRQHALTVKDGELIDNNDQMGRRVKYAFKLQTS